MPAKKKAEAPPVENKASGREPDVVAMLSVRADGTPDQFEPILLTED